MATRIKILELMHRVEEVGKNSLLLEAMSLPDIHDKYYPHLFKEVFDEIVAADPTSTPDKMGKYSKWLLQMQEDGKLDLDNLSIVTKDLELFDKYKNVVAKRDITKCASPKELSDIVEPFREGNQATSKSDEIRKIKENGAEKAYEDQNWLVIIPKTEKAAIYYGKGTKWCTSATFGENPFDMYNKYFGPLYININKHTGDKFQFCIDPDNNELKDATNEEIPRPVPQSIGMTKGLIHFYQEKMGFPRYFRLYYDSVDDFCDGLARVYVKNKGYNYIDTKGNLLLDEDSWLSQAQEFSEGVAPVQAGRHQPWLILQDNGKLIQPKENCRRIATFTEGFAPVFVDKKGFNYIDKEGNILADQWFSLTTDNFCNGWGRVGNRFMGASYYNFINAKGEFISDTWFDSAGNIDDDGRTWVKKNGKFFWFDTKGKTENMT